MGADELVGTGWGAPMAQVWPPGPAECPQTPAGWTPRGETKAQLVRGRKRVLSGVAEPQLGPHSQILDAYWENNKLLNGKGCLKNWLLPQIKMAMVINGEFLVSISSGLTLGGPLALGRGWEEHQAGGMGEPVRKAKECHAKRWFSEECGQVQVWVGTEGRRAGQFGELTEGWQRGAGRVMHSLPPPSLLARTSYCCPCGRSPGHWCKT